MANEKTKDNFSDLDKIIEKEFTDAIDISKVDTKVKTWYDSGVYAFNYICSKSIYGAYPKGRITGIDGLPSTGKSLMASVAMRDPQIDRIIIIESEGGGNSAELIEFAGVDPKKVRIMKASTLQSYSINKKNGAIEEVPDNKIPKIKETDKYLYVEGAGLKVRKLAHAIQFNKVKGNFLIIMDSLGNMQSIRGLAGGFDMGKRGQDFTNFFKNFDNEFEKAGLTFIFTNKLYQNIGSIGGPSHVQTGGESPIYNSSLYIRLSTTVETDDVTTTQMEAEKKQRQTALGSSLKTIKAKVVKSRFGTEMRNIPFLLDFSVGPVRLSGLFKLLYDFGVIIKKSGAYYEIPEIWEKSFYKKDFASLVLKDEKKLIDKFQELLIKREVEIKIARQGIQASDLDEVLKEEEEFDSNEMIAQMEKDKEK